VRGNLPEIRKLASRTVAQARLGQDVMSERQEKKAAEAEATNRPTLSKLIPEYLEARRRGIGFKRSLRTSSYGEVERHLLRNIALLHDRDPRVITRADLVQLLDGIARTKGRTTADRVKATLSTFFKWLLDRGYTDAHPAIGLPSNGHSEETRPLTIAELRDVWQACRDDDYGRLVRLGVLTALRRQNLGDLRWTEVDLDQRLIKIPGDCMKNRREFTLPLCEPAAAILSGIEKRGDFVFGECPGSGFSGWSKAKAALDKRIAEARNSRGEPPMPPWKLHGLRATFATLMNEKRLAGPHIIDELLAHVGPHKASVAGRYNQADYKEEKREAIEAWGKHIQRAIGSFADVENRTCAMQQRRPGDGLASLETPRIAP
jgi:integrase